MSQNVQPKRELKKRIKINKIYNDLKEELKDLTVVELLEMKANPELIKYACNLVETAMKKKYKPNKKEIVIGIMVKLIPSINDADKKVIGDAIEFLHGNGDIRKITLLKTVGKYVVECLKKKLSN
jgi:hypothetical protein